MENCKCTEEGDICAEHYQIAIKTLGEKFNKILEAATKKEKPTLRDQFAMSIASAVFANAIGAPEFNNETWENTMLAVAKVCYKFADAMLAEREKK